MTLRLALVELEDVRRFRGRWRVGPFSPGLNVLAAPNEAGKSTLLAAIQAAIFLPHRSVAEEVKALRPLDGGVPSIALALDGDTGRWMLRKRFAGDRGQAELAAPTGRTWSADAAEEEIRRLFGVSVAAGRREVPRGVWGALWVTQGASFTQPALDSPAAATLKDALAAQVGVVTGGAGARRIRARIDETLAGLQTPTGRPKGELKAALEQAAQAQANRLDLAQRRNEVERLLGEVDRLRAAIARRMAERREETLEAERTAAERAAADLAAAAERRRRAEQAAEQAAELARAAASALQSRRALIAAAEQRQAAAGAARAAEAAAAAQRRAAEEKAQSAREALAAARQARVEAETAFARARALAELPALAQAADEAKARALDAREAWEALAQAEAERDAILVTPDRLAAIETAAATLAARRAAAEAEAPRLTISVAPGAEVLRDGETMAAGETTLTLLSPLVLAVPGVMRLALDPCRNAAVAAILEAEAALAAALREAGVADLASARAAAERRRQREAEATRLRGKLTGLVGSARPSALAEADQRAMALAARLAERLQRLGLSEVPEEGETGRALAEAQARCEAAEAAERAAEAALAPLAEAERRAREQAAAAEASRAAAEQELAQAEAALAADRARLTDEALAERAREAEREAADRAAERDRLPAPDAEALALATARVEHVRGQLKAERDAARREAEALARAEGELQALEGVGLDELIAAAEADEKRARAEAAALEARRRALVLLREAITAADREATERYLDPVVRRLQPWLSHLLPDARVGLDESFRVTGLTRSGRDERFDILSAGTQEQIAVLVRLAFADLLERQGKPAPVILDDALVFSDDARIERMFDVLTDAAKTLQIVVLTCRRELFGRLPAHPLAFEQVP